MKDIIIDFQKFWECKVQLTLAINFFSTKIVDKERVMHSKSDNAQIKTYDNGNGFVDELFESLFSRYQIGLETTIRINNFIFDSVKLFYYEFHKISFKRGISYIESLG